MIKLSYIFLSAFAPRAFGSLAQRDQYSPHALRMIRSFNDGNTVDRESRSNDRRVRNSGNSEVERDDDDDDNRSDSKSNGQASSNPVVGSSNLGDSNWSAYEGLLDCNLYSSFTVANGRLLVREALDPINGTLTVEMIYKGRAWLAMSCASDGTMIGNTAVVGRPDLNLTAKYAMRAETVAGVKLLPSQNQTLIDASIQQNATHTVMRFTKLLSESNEQQILQAPRANTALYAVGPGNVWDQHQYMGSFTVTYTYCLKPGQNATSSTGNAVAENVNNTTQQLRILHGFFMAFGWGVLVPLAIGASLLRSILPFSEGTWFKIHRGLNLSAFACILSGFIVALSNEKISFPDLLQQQKHVAYGFSVIVIVFVQVMSGLLRPHLHAPTTTPPPVTEPPEKGLRSTVKDESEHGKPPNERVPEALEQNQAKANPHQEKTAFRAAWEVIHRLMGLGLLAFAWFTVQTGLELYESFYEKKNGLAIFFWTVASVIGFIVFCLTIYVKVRR